MTLPRAGLVPAADDGPGADRHRRSGTGCRHIGIHPLAIAGCWTGRARHTPVGDPNVRRSSPGATWPDRHPPLVPACPDRGERTVEPVKDDDFAELVLMPYTRLDTSSR